MKESIYKSYDELPLFLNADTVAKVLGIANSTAYELMEIISDVFVMIWKNAEYIDLEKGTIRSYISASARNFALKRLNKKSEYTSIDDVELPDITNFTEDCSQGEHLWKAVMKLGEPDNEIFVRFYKFDEKLKDISKATGLNISTIKSIS